MLGVADAVFAKGPLADYVTGEDFPRPDVSSPGDASVLPLLVAGNIGVAVKDGAVTLTGHVTTYAQKLAAVRAAERVHGVKAVADELTVHPPGERDDQDIARAIAHVLTSNVHVPGDKVHAQVKNRWVTLEGEVDYPTSGLKLSG